MVCQRFILLVACVVVTVVLSSARRAAADFSFNFTDFQSANLGQMRLNGSATVATDGVNVLRLTQSASQAGSAFINRQLNFAHDFSFSTQFSARLWNNGGLSDVDGSGADGITFVVHDDPRGITALGGSGGSLGVHDIRPALIVELDTWHNGWFDVSSNENSNGDHLAINVNAPNVPAISLVQTGSRPCEALLCTGRG